MKKEITALGLSALLCLGLLAGCGEKDSDPAPTDTTPAITAEPENTDEPAVPAQPNKTDEADVKTFEITMEGESIPTEMTRHKLDMGENGVICVSVRLDEDSVEGHSPRFDAMLDTIEIVKA